MIKRIIALTMLIFIMLFNGCHSPTENDDIAVSNIAAETESPNPAIHTTEPVMETSTPKSEPITHNIEETDPYGNSITWDDDSSNFPLYAMIRSEDMYLYGVKPYGMVLYRNGKGTYFEWPGLTPHAVLPQMLYDDFDGDGEKELAVILYVGSGTGVALMELHILSIEDNGDWAKPTYTDYAILPDNISEWMTEEITTEAENYGTFVKSYWMYFCGEKYNVKNYDLDKGAFLGFSYGDIVYFDYIDNQFWVKIALGASYENYATTDFFGDIKARVNFNGNEFYLSDYSFTMLP